MIRFADTYNTVEIPAQLLKNRFILQNMQEWGDHCQWDYHQKAQKGPIPSIVIPSFIAEKFHWKG